MRLWLRRLNGWLVASVSALLLICLLVILSLSLLVIFLPAWFLGKFPHKKVIQTSHTAELAVGFGRKVRNLVDHGDIPRAFFPSWPCKATQRRRDDGTRTRAATTSLSVLAVR